MPAENKDRDAISPGQLYDVRIRHRNGQFSDFLAIYEDDNDLGAKFRSRFWGSEELAVKEHEYLPDTLEIRP
jgi:hypothetical protein